MTTVARAARLHAHGDPLRVEQVDLARPEPGEVLVNLAFAAVNPVDRYGAAGKVAPDGPLPRTLGSEAAGTVGSRRVVVHGHGVGSTRDGVWASAAVVPEAALVPVPDGVDLQHAAAMGVAGVTAWRTTTELAKVSAGDLVLVLGASGGVGSMIVSLAAGLGATVVGQTGDAAKAGWVAARGADRVVVGGPGDLVGAFDAAPPTVVFDPLGAQFTGRAVDVAAEGGRIVIFGTSAGADGTIPLQVLYRKGLTVFGYGGLIEPAAAITTGIGRALDALASGAMSVEIGAVAPLAGVNDALRDQADRRVLGKLVLDVRGA